MSAGSATAAPPVVAVVVTHEPGEWFRSVLDGLAAQDYANLRTLFLISGDPGDIETAIGERLPDALIHRLDGDPGFGESANTVLELVEGDRGFFCVMHDDVALERSTIRLLVEELYRSNAGMVGPKLVSWEDRRILANVGLAVDSFGEVDTMLEPGEADQEQHDSVSDVFALPSACLLVRADLFRELGGFHAAYPFHGDDVELCWRAHLIGARTVVAPAARARHRGRLEERRPDLDHATMAARHRVTTMATLTGAGRLPLVVVRSLTLTLGQLLVGLFTGGAGRAGRGLRAHLGLIPRLGAVLARRRAVRPLRRIAERDVAAQQLRGSARIGSYLRGRGSMPADPEATVERRWRQTAGTVPAITWIVLIVALVIGSRQLLTGGVPRVGQFAPFPDRATDLWHTYRSGWWNGGLGSEVPAPTGVALIGVGGVLTAWRMGLWHTLAVVGLLALGWLGAWRLLRLFPTARARVAGVLVYAALPLSTAAIASGRWSVLGCYAATPWVVHFLRRAAGVESVGAAASDVVEQRTTLPRRIRLQVWAGLVLATALPMAFAPAFGLVVVGIGVVCALAGVVAGSEWRTALHFVVAALAAVLAAFVLHLPWSTSWFGRGWSAVNGVEASPAGELGMFRLARFEVGPSPLGTISVAAYLAVLGALILARSWRLTWAMRAAALVLGFLGLAVLVDRHAGGILPTEPGVLLAVVAVGLAIASACLVAALQDDVRAGGFGWKQPVALLCSLGIVAALAYGVIAPVNGRWNLPRSSLRSVLAELPVNAKEGNSRVLWVGDPQLIPVGSWMFRPGIGFAVTDDGQLGVEEGWANAPTDAEVILRQVVATMADETTFRSGRLLAEFGVRYVVVPLGPSGTRSVPTGLIDALDDQLDLTKPFLSPLEYVIYENTAWMPTRGMLTAPAKAVADDNRLAAIAAVDPHGGTPFAVGAKPGGPAVGDVPAGMLHVASPLSPNWTLTVAGKAAVQRPMFAATAGFVVDAPGRAVLRYSTPWTRGLMIALQAVLWVAVAVLATRLDPTPWLRRRRARRAVAPATLLTMDDSSHELPAWQPGQPLEELDDVWGDES